jgi:transcription antitermination factor NusG
MESGQLPGYIFAQLDLATDIWTRIRHLPGVRSLVEIGGGPCPVDEAIVERIRQWIGSYQPVPVRLRPGNRVTVTAGASRRSTAICVVRACTASSA